MIHKISKIIKIFNDFDNKVDENTKNIRDKSFDKLNLS